MSVVLGGRSNIFEDFSLVFLDFAVSALVVSVVLGGSEIFEGFSLVFLDFVDSARMGKRIKEGVEGSSWAFLQHYMRFGRPKFSKTRMQAIN